MIPFSDALALIVADAWCRVEVVEAHEAALQGLTLQTFRERRRAMWALTHTARECAAIEADHARDRAWDLYELALKETFPLPFRFDLARIIRMGSHHARRSSKSGSRVLHIRALEPVWKDGGFSLESGTLLCGLGPESFDVVGVNRIDESMPPNSREVGVSMSCSRCEEASARWATGADVVSEFLTTVGSNNARAL
jgi:hypothetical protein